MSRVEPLEPAVADRLRAAEAEFEDRQREAAAVLARAADARADAIRKVADDGASLRQIADVIGVSRARVQQLLDAARS